MASGAASRKRGAVKSRTTGESISIRNTAQTTATAIRPKERLVCRRESTRRVYLDVKNVRLSQVEYFTRSLKKNNVQSMTPPTPPNGHITARLYTDPSCPYGYSANPALRVLEWRYREQIQWELVMIGLSEPGDPPSPFSQTDLSVFQIDMRSRYGMPFTVEPKIRNFTSSRSCQAIVSARLNQPGSEWKVLRALQLLQFNSPLLLDDDEQLRAAISTVAGLDADAIVDAIDTDPVQAAYRADYAESRQAAGGAGDLQGKTKKLDEGGSRFTAPSIMFSLGEFGLEAAGIQSVEAYDIVVANLNPGLRRTPPPESAFDAVHLYPSGLTTQEVAAIMTEPNDIPDRVETERELVRLTGEGRVNRVTMGDDAIWLAN